MTSKLKFLVKYCSPYVCSKGFRCLNKNPVQIYPAFIGTFTAATYSTISQPQVGDALNEGLDQPKTSMEVLRRWGCSDNDIDFVLKRCPSLRKADVTYLQDKLCILKELGITSPDLVKIINCRPRFLSRRINHCFDERLEYLMALFGSKEMLLKAIVRNPSLLTYDFDKQIKATITLYEGMGISREDLVPLILSRPTLFARSSFNDEKMRYIRKTGLSKDSKMYKHIVTLIGISRIETIDEKVANLEKFGISDEEIWGLFGRSPLLLTLSVDKVQRNMTFIVGTMKLPANVIINNPSLLYNNLEIVLKPRVLLAGKLEDMDLCPKIKGPSMLRALRMTEDRLLRVFVSRHPQDVAKELMEFYTNAKGIKRLAATSKTSKKNLRKGFPF